jgi:hypothetical protein
MFNMIILPDLLRSSQLARFIDAARTASSGNPAILELLVDAFGQWHEMDELLECNIRRTWNRSRRMKQGEDAVAILRNFCTEQQVPLPATMVEAIFNDPSFDFIAYLTWHNSEQ